MKKIVSILSIFAATAAIASSVQSDNTFGVMKLNIGTATGQTIIGVPWENVGGGDINVNKIMLTNNLAVNDQLWYFNQGTKNYQVWKLTAEGWSTSGAVIPEGTDSEAALDETAVPRGSALIIDRKTEGSSGDIYLYGQYTGSTATNSIASNPAVALFSLIAPTATTGSTVDLNSGLDYVGEPLEGDQIIQGAGTDNIYTYRKPTGESKLKWCKSEWETAGNGKIQKFVDSGVTLPVGKGAWYLRTKASGDYKLIWK